MKILSALQVKNWDAYTIQQEPIASIDLMERAALQCTEWLISKQLTHQPIRIFCGKGNNGGDGLAIARQLIIQNIHPTIYILEFGHKGTDDFQVNLQRLHQHTTDIHFIQSASMFPLIQPGDVVIDALFGTGLNRPLEGLTAALVQHINASGATVVSIDLPSGMLPDASSQRYDTIHATHTLSFQSYKLCHLVAENETRLGTVRLLNIGLHPAYLTSIPVTYELSYLPDIAALYQPRKVFAHKGKFGHALIIGGAKGKTGAALIATEACLRSGAGVTTTLLMSGNEVAINTRCPEAMTITADDLEAETLSRFTSIGIGPGLGTDEPAVKILAFILKYYKGKLVLDADALNIISRQKELMDLLPDGTILTPHPREFDRLFGCHTDDFARLETAIDQSKHYPFTIVLKGHYTLIAHGGKGYFNTSGNAGLAKGGSGDALTGIITALAAQPYSGLTAARLGVFLHGLAADLALQCESTESLTATDISDYIGLAFKKLSNVSD